MKIKDSFKNFFRSFSKKLCEIFDKKLVIALTFTAIGALSILTWQHFEQKFLHKNRFYSTDFDGDFFESLPSNFKSKLEEQNKLIDQFWSNNPRPSKIFEELAEIEEEMHRSMIANHKKMEKIFEESRINETLNQEDSKTQKPAKNSDPQPGSNFFLTKNISDIGSIYELHFQGFKPEDIEVKIDKNFLIFRAENKQTASDQKDPSKQIHRSSNFYYSASLSGDEEKGKLEVIRQPSKITAKIIKKSVVN